MIHDYHLLDKALYKLYPDRDQVPERDLRYAATQLLALHESKKSPRQLHTEAQQRRDGRYLAIVIAYLAVFHPRYCQDRQLGGVEEKRRPKSTMDEVYRFRSDDVAIVALTGHRIFDVVAMASHLEHHLEDHHPRFKGGGFFVQPIRADWEMAGNGEALFLIQRMVGAQTKTVGSILVNSSNHNHVAKFTIGAHG